MTTRKDHPHTPIDPLGGAPECRICGEMHYKEAPCDKEVVTVVTTMMTPHEIRAREGFAKYPKIQSVYKRDEKGNFLAGQYATRELAYLSELPWTWTEKIDGTNIRVHIVRDEIDLQTGQPMSFEYGGRTDNAQIPATLIKRLDEIFRSEEMAERVLEAFGYTGPVDVTLFGEGYGAGIQKGGAYIPDGVNFTVFDVKVGPWWLREDDVSDVADKLGIARVPYVGTFDIPKAVSIVMNGAFESIYGGVVPEGIVGKPFTPLFGRRGERIITKVKGCDFK